MCKLHVCLLLLVLLQKKKPFYWQSKANEWIEVGSSNLSENGYKYNLTCDSSKISNYYFKNFDSKTRIIV